ncbi:MAG: hypothetical protein ACE5F9_13855, partial [Phycisphaerae bacterium]
HDWVAQTRLIGSAESISLQPYGAAVGTARHWRTLPDLLPPEVRRKRRIDQARRAVSACAPITAAALIGLATLFGQISSDARPTIAACKRQMNSVRDLMGEVRTRTVTKQVADTLERQLRRFATSSPQWIGFFKELSILLPEEFDAERIQARMTDGGIHVTITGRVHTQGTAVTVDEIVYDRMLRQLGKSPFIDEVTLLNESRNPASGTEAAGQVSIDVALAYHRERQES